MVRPGINENGEGIATESAGEGVERIVYTIGHSNHTLAHFIALLRSYNIKALVDVRSHPYSRYVPHFDRERLRRSLAKAGIVYVYMGNELGGRPKDPEFYDARGRVDYVRLAESGNFRRGISRLLGMLSKFRVALMCGEEDPTYCHRRLLVARALAGYGLEFYHIRGDGRALKDAELGEHKPGMQSPKQLTLF